MAKLIDTFPSPIGGMQGILVAILDSGNVYVVQEEIDEALDAAQWVADNNAQIIADIPTKGTQVTAEIVAAMLDDIGESTSEIIDGIDDITNLFPNTSQRKVLWAIIRLMVNQLNVLRALHSLPDITYVQAQQAIVDEYKLL